MVTYRSEQGQMRVKSTLMVRYTTMWIAANNSKMDSWRLLRNSQPNLNQEGMLKLETMEAVMSNKTNTVQTFQQTKCYQRQLRFHQTIHPANSQFQEPQIHKSSHKNRKNKIKWQKRHSRSLRPGSSNQIVKAMSILMKILANRMWKQFKTTRPSLMLPLNV